MKSLVIETAFLGDAIVSLSLARELKRLDPSCSVSYLVRPDAVEIIGSSPDVDDVIPFDKRGSESGLRGIRNKAKELNGKRFDTLFLLHGSSRSQRLSSLLDIPRKVGFDSAARAGLTKTIPDTGWLNRYQRATLLAKAIFPNADANALPHLVCPLSAEVAAFCERFSRTVAVAPGSVWETKKWGDERYAGLASRISNDGIGVVVIGDGKSATAGERIQTECIPGSVLDITGRTSLTDSAGAIAACSLLVANDSAPTHLAVAVGTPFLTIFGPTVPAFGFAPPQGTGETIEVHDLWCRPCASHGSNQCPVYSHDCMAQITVDMVFDKVQSMLKAIR